ncbi:DUF4422 domain-containing protein [Martelella mediterranea]|uniref:Lipopolysaccharide biosynthesis glycosyltransferase n=1 Tax=Martelella mediterranea TaxID=293089 RepID=A0A4R3NXU2_9HYPH|nr:DUF4422 domain-containing protein [Martelella mediterranea]TCT44966.1 lipopolysaccharide biosynthesis glycosyltransferase [Martelella mediterranea]
MISKKIFISVVYFKPAPLVQTEYLNPVQAGKALGRYDVEGAIGDDNGKNISEKNVSWNELTALYWMRHNVDADYYGLMHYRRLMVFAEKKPKAVTFSDITEREFERYGWNDALIEKACESADILTPPVRDIYLPGMPEVLMTAGEFYAHQHHSRDMDILEAVVKERSPEIYPYFVDMLVGRKIFFNSITVMRKPFFEEYSDWLFDILEEVEKRSDTSDYDSYQSRIWGFLAEYLANVYVSYAKFVHGAKVRECPLTWGVRQRPAVAPETVLSQARTKAESKRVAKVIDENDGINVVLAVDDNYIPHASVTILSAIRTSSTPNQLRFFILNGRSVSGDNRTKLKKLAENEGARLTFLDIDDRDLRWLPLNRDYISIATYYRLVMHAYLPETVKKAIYLDADTIVIDPIEELWSTSMDGHPVAGAPDDAGFLQARRLQLTSHHRYFNAGIMLFDIAKFRAMDLQNEIISAFRKHGAYIVSQDQDILNILFEQNTKMLHLRWNAGSRIYRANPLEPSYDEQEAFEAASDPAIVHFTDKRKPWHLKCTHPLTELYWDYRNETPWAETQAERVKRKTVYWLRRHLRARDRRFDSKLGR